MNFSELLKYTVENKASDLHITTGIPPVMRKNGKLVRIGEDKILPADTETFIHELLNEDQYEEYRKKGELD